MSQRKAPKRKLNFVNIESRTASQGTRGQASGAWSTVMSDIPATVVKLTGGEAEVARKLFASATYRVEMFKPNNLTVTVKHRLKYGTRYLQIGDVDHDEEKNRDLILLCSEAT